MKLECRMVVEATFQEGWSRLRGTVGAAFSFSVTNSALRSERRDRPYVASKRNLEHSVPPLPRGPSKRLGVEE